MTQSYYSLFLSFVVILFVSCQEPEEIPEPESGRILLRLTDAPFPHDLVSQVNVTFSKVAVLPASTDHKDADLTQQMEISKIPLSVNLLQLTNGITITMANTDVLEGDYKGLKLFISKASIRLRDSRVFDLNLGTRNGKHYELFVPVNLEIQAGLTKDLLLDFDVSRSFIPRYSTDSRSDIAGFLFNPTVKLSDAYNSGSITGIITSSLENKISRLEGAQITILSAGSVVTTTFTDFSGMYTVLGLDPGNYDIQVDMKGYDTQMMSNVLVRSQEQTKQGVLLTNLE